MLSLTQDTLFVYMFCILSPGTRYVSSCNIKLALWPVCVSVRGCVVRRDGAADKQTKIRCARSTRGLKIPHTKIVQGGD